MLIASALRVVNGPEARARMLSCVLLGLAGVSLVACELPSADTQRAHAQSPGLLQQAVTSPALSKKPVKRAAAPELTGRVLHNRSAYIPPQCYTKTRDREGRVQNPCYVCHTDSVAPNYVDDAAFQRVLQFPPLAATNPWTNLFSPAIERAPALSDETLSAYVRQSNYVDEQGKLLLAEQLAHLPQGWDGDGDARWSGYVPDAYFQFDRQGFDLRPDGSPSGWRSFAYAPLPGTFFPTNGSATDVLIRLDPALRESADGKPDATVTAVNLAIVEALISRHDVSIAPVDETTLGVDLDLDGKLAQAVRVTADVASGEATRMQYVGRARELTRAGSFPIAPGLFPLGTEFLHSLRYLDVRSSGEVALGARMKELRYAKKVRWFSYGDLKAHVAKEAVELSESADGLLYVLWQHDRGISNGQGWLLQGFIEDQGGDLRPQSYEETVFCAGCHGGIGATTDSMFSFARKRSGPDDGWFHASQRGLATLPEPRRSDGQFEYSFYLRQNRAGDEYRENQEVLARFFDKRGAPRQHALDALHADVSTLLMPSAARARQLNRAYRAVVIEQSFVKGRDAVLQASTNVHHEVKVDAPTGIKKAVKAW